MPGSVLADLVHHVSASTGLSPAQSERVLEDVLDAMSDPVATFVTGRHRELHARGMKNNEIWPALQHELRGRRFPAPELSERQLRRIVYG